MSNWKLLTVAGSAVPVGPLPLFAYVLEYVPPSTGRLVQQLSLPPPQLVMPAPPGTQLSIGDVAPSVTGRATLAAKSTWASRGRI